MAGWIGGSQRMEAIRKADKKDLARISEIEIFNYRLYFYPIFQNDDYYFGELQVPDVMRRYEGQLDSIIVYDDGVVKGFVQIENTEVKKLFVEPILHSAGIGSILLDHAVKRYHADCLWALEKNAGAISFYERHGFQTTSDRKLEEGTSEYLVRLIRPFPAASGTPV